MPADAPARVLLVSPESTGGIGRHVQMLATELSGRGHPVTVTAPPATLARLDLPSPVARVPLARFRRLRGLASRHDVTHAHGVRMGALATAARVSPLVTTWHNAPIGSRPRRGVHALLERIGARGSAVVLGASADLVERAHRAGARDARLCPVAAPAQPVVRRGAPGGDVATVLAVARLHPQKRLDLLIDATAGWRQDVQVVVAGDGPLRGELEQRARSAGAPVRFLGARDDVADLLAAATVLALPSDWEARPLVAQEALRAGVPLVATAVGGVPDLVGEAAVLVPPGDAAALREALQRVLDDAALRERLAAAGPRQAATWPDVAAMVDLVEAAYDAAAARRR